ncbi:MAG TPA: hypothetical protein VMY42_28465 [Thermoguttaceae bacterium]|nr:hypothetical protein [Thermoguttaceae bacterium]
MRAARILILSFAWAPLAWGTTTVIAAGQVRLELVGDSAGSALVFQEWLQVLGRAGVKNVRIRSATGAVKVGVEVLGTESQPVYVVTGIVRSSDELLLPAGRFRQSDASRLARWLEDLAQHGPQRSGGAEQSAFGLSAAQFEQVRQDLARPVDFATRGMTRDAAVDKIAAQLLSPLQLEAGLRAMLREDTLGEELSGVSSGTALAYVLRPMGSCLVPRPMGGRVAYLVVKAQPDLEVWPVGWEPEGPRQDVLPAAFEFYNVNIQGVSAAQALEAIGKRLDVAVLIDHNALARHGIDPSKVPVSHPAGRTTYSLVLRKILFQARLKSEIRVDEAGTPFLWVSTIKPV